MEYLGDILLEFGGELVIGREYKIQLPDHLVELILSSSNDVKEAVLRDQIRFENYESAEMLKNSINDNK